MNAPTPSLTQKSARQTRKASARALANFPKMKTHEELGDLGIDLDPLQFDKQPPPMVVQARIGRGGARNIIPPAASQVWQHDPEDANHITVGMTPDGKLRVELEILMRSRMLITASSGGGKSFALRKLLEETCTRVQQIIIDPEGEFDTLTDIHPYAVFNERDDKMPISQSSPFALAQEIVKSNVSSILDLSEFIPEEKQIFVQRFIKGLMELDKEHWRHVIVVLDEAHIFAPQWDKAAAKKSVIDLATRGRKRGYCPVLATQRFSMLNKSVVAELQNRMIGQTGLDIDLRRAATELGMSVLTTTAALTALEPGNFLIYGPALTKTITHMKVGPVQTRHGVQLGDISPPAAASDQFMNSIYALVKVRDEKKEAAEAADKAKAENESKRKAQEEADNKEKLKIAKQRVALVQAIINAKTPERKAKAIAKAAQKENVTTVTVYSWLKKYDERNPVVSMTPKRIARYS